MCIAMHVAGETIEVATRANDIRVPRLQAAGIKVHILPFGGKIDVFTGWRLGQIIKAFQPSIVQCWMSRAPAKVPRWKESMGIPRYAIVSRLGSPYKIKYFKKSDYFISVTPDIAAYLVEQGIEASRVRHINNFAEVERASSDFTRSDFGTPEEATLLLGLGRLHDDKAFDTLIKAAAKLPRVHLWIAGEGPLRNSLQKLIDKLGVESRVKLIGWQTDRARLFELADICTFISRNEGFGTVFVQSWAQRVPVIVSDADGPRQFVRDGEDGLMVPVDDVDAIAAAVERVITDDNLAASLVGAGYRRYEREFTKQACLQRYLEYYHHILQQVENADL
jgi:glycosyltransferase involved in cell wall biosynthesis